MDSYRRQSQKDCLRITFIYGSKLKKTPPKMHMMDKHIITRVGIKAIRDPRMSSEECPIVVVVCIHQHIKKQSRFEPSQSTNDVIIKSVVSSNPFTYSFLLYLNFVSVVCI